MSEDHNYDGEQPPKRPRKPRSPKHENAPYKVGKGKPPAQHRFKPGNKFGRGRKKGSTNKSDYLELIEEMVPVGEDKAGRTIKKPMKEVIHRRLANKAANGEPWAVKLSIELERKARERLQAEPAADDPETLELRESYRKMVIDLLNLVAELKHKQMGDYFDGKFRLYGPDFPKPEPRRRGPSDAWPE